MRTLISPAGGYAPKELIAYLDSLTFLGRVTGSHAMVVAGSTEEFVFDYEVGAAALADGVRRNLPGVELFVEVERTTDAALPTEIAGTWTLPLPGASLDPHPVYLHAHEATGAKVWTSSLFIRHENQRPAASAPFPGATRAN